MIRSVIVLTVFALMLISSIATASLPQACESAASNWAVEGARLVSSEWLDAGEQSMAGRAVPLPAHCRLVVSMNERRSPVDGKDYAIGFEMRLPENWNRRFLVQANGGNDGALVPALGNFGNNPEPALAKGFAVVSSDAGHRSERGSLLGGSAFGFDPQARLDYGYNAHLTLTPVAKAIVENVYGSAPDRSYFMGCSNGGRHAMVAASRLANEYDGFVAGNPGFNLPKAAVQHAWDVQALSRVNADIAKSFSREDMRLIADAVVKACDDLDGLRDGMVNALRQCQNTFKLEELSCRDGDNACLREVQLKILRDIFAGPRNSRGEALYSDWPFDAGVGGADWRRWKIESPIAGLPLIATLGAGSLANIFVTPPDTVAPTPPALLNYLREFDFDVDAPRIYATEAPYKQSAMDFMTPPEAGTLPALFAGKSKLLVYHGASDGVFSVNDSIRWYEELDQNHDGEASKSVRLFVVPGMNHCSGGPATDRFDMLEAVVQWVEEGRVPDSVYAEVNSANPELPADWSKARSRPLCPYPRIARYKGEGDREAASSFYCE